MIVSGEGAGAAAHERFGEISLERIGGAPVESDLFNLGRIEHLDPVGHGAKLHLRMTSDAIRKSVIADYSNGGVIILPGGFGSI